MDYYSNLYSWVVFELMDGIVDLHLKKFPTIFEVGGWSYGYLYVNDAGREKLKKDFPSIWKEFDLNNIPT